MNEQEEFEFQLQLEKERNAALKAGPATGRTDTGKSAPDVKIQSATDILKDTGVGALRSATNVGTHLVDALTTLPDLSSRFVSTFAPKLGAAQQNVVKGIRQAGKEGREFWQQRYKEAGPAAGIGGFATDMAASGGPVRPAAKIAASVLPKVENTLNRASLTGGISGGTSGALTSDDPETGGLVGGLIGVAAPRVLHKVIKGFFGKSDAAKALEPELDKTLTIGQAAPRTAGGLVTQGSESVGRFVPIAGSSIENTQQQAVQAWRRAALRRADIPETPAGGPAAPTPRLEVGKSALDVIKDQRRELAKRRAQAVRDTTFRPDEELERKILEIQTDPDRLLDAQAVSRIQKAYERTLMQRIRGQTPTAPESPIIVPEPSRARGTSVVPRTEPGTDVGIPGQIPGGPKALPPPWQQAGPQPPPKIVTPPPVAHWTGADIEKARKVFARAGRQMVKSGGNDPFRSATGQAMIDISNEILEMVARQNPNVGATLKALEAPRAALKVLRAAAEKSGGHGGFTPERLRSQSEKMGHENLETLARHGEEVFRATDTSLRQSSGNNLRSLGKAAAVITNILKPETALLTLGPALGYRPTVQKALLGDTKLQKAVADYVRKIGATDILGE